VPIAIKDNICTEGVPTSAGCLNLKEYKPPYDATVVARLRQSDAIVIGKTNMDEFGMGSTTENSAFKPSFNAWSKEHVAGNTSAFARHVIQKLLFLL
jgi:aspartyl-tRNA(Asn)/glutamyl-tRNA(Gln) amidotransferase subunit A